MSDHDNAVLKLNLKSSTGYSCETTYNKVYPKQWGQVVAVLEGTDPRDMLVDVLLEYFRAAADFANTTGHPDATVEHERAAEKRYEEATSAVRTLIRNGLLSSTAHDLYTDADKDRPDVICDSNGSVTLGLCKRCGRAEAELTEPCQSRSA